jgi:hypothetical protein
MDYRHSGHHSSRQISVDSPVYARPQPLAHENSSQQSLNAYSPRPEQESQAYQYHDLDSVFFFQRQQQRQQNPALNTTYPGAGVHSEILQIHSGWDTVVYAPIETALHSQNDSMHLNTHTGNSGLLPADLSSSHTSDSTSFFYHRHYLTKQHALSTSDWTGHNTSSHGLEENSTLSVVGNPGMPKPAARPAGPKLRFTPEDDALLVDLKETKDLSWKQIADFFPGRSSGTLQVRYCTKLKAKEIFWTEALVSP